MRADFTKLVQPIFSPFNKIQYMYQAKTLSHIYLGCQLSKHPGYLEHPENPDVNIITNHNYLPNEG